MLLVILRRFGAALLLLLLLSAGAFLLLDLAPGDTAAVIAARQLGHTPSPADVERVRREAGLDRPLALQYARWLAGVVRGDLGVSLRTGLPVAQELRQRLGPTLLLAGATALLTALVGVPLGALAALHPHGLFDHTLRLLALLGAAVPNFWLAFVLVLLFAVQLQWLPVFGMRGGGALVLPVATLAVATIARLSQLARALLLDERQAGYVVAARARGLREQAILWGHLLPNVAGPLLTLLIGQLAAIATGAVIIETLFAWPGIGAYFVDAVAFRDLPVVQALVLCYGTTFVVLNLVADLLHARLDPRVRLG